MGTFKPVLEPPTPGFLSFVNLTEAFVLFAMRRRYKIQMPRIRDAVSYVESKMGVAHPLAFQQFRTNYVDLFVRTVAGDVNVSRGGQIRLDELCEELDRIEWQHGRPIALFPIVTRREDDSSRPIRISPLVAFGRPVLAGTRIPTSVVCGRFYGGESVVELAEDYGIAVSAIEEAVRAESDPAAA
jgi:uncharacterized protein (DUF433 family)